MRLSAESVVTTYRASAAVDNLVKCQRIGDTGRVAGVSRLDRSGTGAQRERFLTATETGIVNTLGSGVSEINTHFDGCDEGVP